MSNDAGIPEFNISKVLGHSTPTTTNKIYTHLFDKKQTDALNAVARMIDAPRKNKSTNKKMDGYER